MRPFWPIVALWPALAAADPAGRWEGVARIPGAPQAIVLDLELDRAGGWSGSVTLPGRGTSGAPLRELSVDGARVRASLAAAIPSFGAPGPAASIELAEQADGRLVGTFRQGGQAAPVELRRSGAPQVEAAPASTPLGADLAGTWHGRYELGGVPREVTLTLVAGAPGQAALLIVGRRRTEVPVDRVALTARWLTLESSAMGLTIEGRWSTARIDATLVQGPFEVPLVLERAP